jgi:hypothetical protein
MTMISLPDSQLILNDPYYQTVEKRLVRLSLGLGLVILFVALFFASLPFIVNFTVGAVISLLNFFWMKQAIDRLLAGFSREERPSGKSAKGIIFKYFIRYALIGGTLYVIVRYKYLNVKGAFLGLFLVVIAVVLECIYQVVKSLIEDWTRGRA